MSSGSQAPRPAPRVARRRALARERIVATAARRFAEAGPGAVRLDEIADGADVARGTLYSHFRTKDDLLCAIVEPVLSAAIRRTRALGRAPARDAVEGLLGAYLDLWHAHPDALRIAYKAQDMPIGDLGRLHREFTAGVLQVFGRARRAGILRSGDPLLAGHVLRQVAVPLLELYGGRSDGDRLFLEGLRALLLSGPPDGGAAVSSRRPRGGRGPAS
jgi:TetR/AcrR family transcriptional regulator, cholesterol catabolism regulator